MEKKSNHPGDVAKWVEKVIRSCETPMQGIGARRLVQNFEKIYGYGFYSCKLRDILDSHKSIRV